MSYSILQPPSPTSAHSTDDVDGPSHFQAPDEVNLHASAQWLALSMDACKVDGSSQLFSPYKGWHNPYPETTGYIIPTFYKYGRRYNKPEFIDRATRMANWVTTLQFDNGALPGGDYISGVQRPPSVFNTGQMIIGLVTAFEQTADRRFLDAAARGASWLANEQDDDGFWRKHAYRPGFSPSYYSRVCWPMLMTTVHTGDEKVKAIALRGLRAIAARQLENGVIGEWSFAPGKPAFTHTIAYTIRGFIESADIVGDRDGLGQVAVKTATKLLHLFEVKKRMAGAYDDEWRGRYWYTCLTGNCQIALSWLRLFDWTGDARFVNGACKAIEFVTRTQFTSRWSPRFLRGAVAGSKPFYGRYLTIRFPNWAAKFLMDAIMFRNERLARIRDNPPRSS